MNVIYPRFTLRQFGWMVVFGLVGAVVSEIYGIVHDQITFRIGPEYFTQFKFTQYYYLDSTPSARDTVMKISLRTAWWIGLFAGWFMGRITLPHESLKQAAHRSAVGVAFMMLTSLVFALAAATWSPTSLTDPRVANQSRWLAILQIQDTLAFIRVGYIHNASYLGGLVGLIGALVWLRLTRPKLG